MTSFPLILFCLLSPLFLLACVQQGQQQGKGRPLSSGAQTSDIQIQGSQIHFLEEGPSEAPTILLLHGARFSSKTWKKLGTLSLLSKAGYHAIAMDLPGFGSSERTELSRKDFLEAFLHAKGLSKVAIVSPSMSGSFSLPFVASHPESVWAFVPVAPASIPRYKKVLEGSRVPCLVIWGEKDGVFPVEGAKKLAQLFSDARILVLQGASHPCYLDQPDRFHQEMLQFFTKHR